MRQVLSRSIDDNTAVSGEFVTVADERFYVIRNVDKTAPFFTSVISSSNHWLFISSNGGLTAGRVSPDTPLFPYIPVDKVHESSSHTGSKTILRVRVDGSMRLWEPFNREHDGLYSLSRSLYKNFLGNKLCFEEINQDLRLAFRYTWAMSDHYGFVRHCELQNLQERPIFVELLDGLQNILPAGTPRKAQTNASNLVNAYKWTELDAPTGLAIYTLYSGVSDRAEPYELLKANTAFCLGLESPTVLLSAKQLNAFRAGAELHGEALERGVRGGYFVGVTMELAPQDSRQWQIIADIEQSQSNVVDLRMQLQSPQKVGEAVTKSIDMDSDELARIVGAADGFQATAEEPVSAHHYSDVLFNVLRGGIFGDQYCVAAQDLRNSTRHFNHDVYARNRKFLDNLPNEIELSHLMSLVNVHRDPQLVRLCHEFLPITFARRHGDPSRPWNMFTIRPKDEYGNRQIFYEGNWRDIFQNWEALSFSYPEFVESIIAKFVNASTIDGYNPYRITHEGIDWEVEVPDDPWGNIGYWGDHQIIYLLKLLELSNQFHPKSLAALLRQSIFSYSNVPYRIRSFEALLENPKSTVIYDHELAERIERRVAQIGADGKRVLDADGTVYQVTLLEKLLVPLLAKLGNLVIDGGIWMNTQRPEWNDANNALVGHGLSMVTLFQLRRYVEFLHRLLINEVEPFELSLEVNNWLGDTATVLSTIRPLLGTERISPEQRFQSLQELGMAANRYRERIYRQEVFTGKVQRSPKDVRVMLDDALAAIDHSIGTNLRDDGLYNAYNLLDIHADSLGIDALYPMLEGQVAALSSGALSAEAACSLLGALFKSDIYREDQHSFMLYPDRQLPGFLEKNRIPAQEISSLPVLERMMADGDHRIVTQDAEANYRFNAGISNVADLEVRLDTLSAVYGEELENARGAILELYEKIFKHRTFTGRSGCMFGFEGLGCIFWHMVSKLLLAVQENFFDAVENGADKKTRNRLGAFYYRVREGLGFNKTPFEHGAFPTDPYSHTPKHAGARQHGMTGAVKEEILSRFGELGVRVRDGLVRFEPALLRALEFSRESQTFEYLDVHGDWQELEVPANALAFTWCQVPLIYRLTNDAEPSLTVTWQDNSKETLSSVELSTETSAEVFARSGRIRQLTLTLPADTLFHG